MKTIAEVEKPLLLQLHVEVSAEGEVTPVIPVSWSLSDKLVTQVSERRFSDPHVLIAVAKRTPYTYGGTDSFDYTTSRVYVVSIESAPKIYAQFAHAGSNVLFSAIIDIDGQAAARRVRRWETKPHEFDLYSYMRWEESNSLDGVSAIRGEVKTVNVPEELFAPPPPKVLRRLVNEFFPEYAVDQCHFRKRLIASVVFSIFVQLYGLVARPLTLLYGLFTAQRGMQWSWLFAFRPHEFARSFQGSFWLKDENGYSRDEWWKFITPPAIVIYAVVLAAGYYLALGIAYVILLVMYGGDLSNVPDGEAVSLVPTIASILVPFGLLVWSIVTGRLFDFVAWICSLIRKKQGKVAKPSSAEIKWIKRQREIEKLRLIAESTRRIESPHDVKDTSVTLRFHNVKAKVCKPFAS